MQKIYIIGNSPTIICAIKTAFEDSEIEIYSWRKFQLLETINKKSTKNSNNLIVVCGYNYRSSLIKFDDYYDSNITKPLNFIKKIANENSSIIYINTVLSSSLKTYSRYLYAKNNLGYFLQKEFQYFYNISIPTIVDSGNNPIIHGSLINKLIFKIFIKIGLLDTVKKCNLSLIIKNYKLTKKDRLNLIEGRLLQIKRGIIVDRILRLLYG